MTLTSTTHKLNGDMDLDDGQILMVGYSLGLIACNPTFRCSMDVYLMVVLLIGMLCKSENKL